MVNVWLDFRVRIRMFWLEIPGFVDTNMGKVSPDMSSVNLLKKTMMRNVQQGPFFSISKMRH